MQLIKLVYIAHGWHLGYFNRPLINETVQAWRYGPVIKSLYDQVRKYGSGAVSAPIPTSIFPFQTNYPQPPMADDTNRLLDGVWRNYAGFSGIDLSNMTHQHDTPWYRAWNDEGGNMRYFAEISNELIADHYRQKIARQNVSAHGS